MAATDVVMPVSLPTSAGTREVLDLGYPVLNLQKLDDPKVSLHQCSQKYGPQGIRSIFEKLQERLKEPQFEELNLSDNHVGDEGADYLKDGLKNSNTLKRLLMPRTGLKTNGFQSIGELLHHCPSLEMLVLSSNLADPAGVEGTFTAGLSKNKSLKSLCLAACRLGNTGVAQLCAGPLASHGALEHVSFSYNRLEDEVCSSVIKMLATNTKLRNLELNGNSLGTQAALDLVKGLASNKTLQKLGLAQNSIMEKGAAALSNHFVCDKGQNLVYLDLRYNKVGYYGCVEIRKMIKKPMDDDEANKGWMINFGERQLMLNAH
ncbi:Protein NLRC3 [Durusdinium trenchii]